MTKRTKAWVIVGLLLILAGAALCAGVLAINHWGLRGLFTTELETRAVEFREEIHSIAVTADTEQLRLLPSNDGSCRVLFEEGERQRHTARVEDGTLRITASDTRRWYEKIGVFIGMPTITVYLPAGEYRELLVEEDTGDVSIPADFSFAEIRVSCSTGDVDCRASASGQIVIGTDTGDIRLEGVSAGAMDLGTHTGTVELSEAECRGDLGLTVTTGKARLRQVSCKSLFSGGDTGDLRMEDLIARERIEVRRSTGDVQMERCDAGELLITTDTGDVTGSLLTEKVFLAQSDTGRIEVPETVSGGTCKIVTETGDISISVG